MMPKTPAFAPMPSVRIPTAVRVKPGCLSKRRALYRTSCQMVRIRGTDGWSLRNVPLHAGFEGPLQIDARPATRARPPVACRQSECYILNLMVQYSRARLDASFAAISDATRRGVLEQLGHADASITDLAERFHMTLTGMKKHVGVLEQAGLITTKKVGRVRTCQLGPRRVEEETAWIERHRQRWDARFDELDKVVEELKRKENTDGRKKRE